MADNSGFNLYDPNDATALDGQKIPYISSRLNFDGTSITAVSAVPHNPTPEANGTAQRIGYGSSPRITRIDGHGNGNRNLSFTAETLNSVISNGYVENPEYDYGMGPIGIKVVDPLNLVNGFFECKFKDYTSSSKWDSIPHAVDTARWVIYRYDKKGGELLDSVLSERTIQENNEQIIPQWGISVNIKQTSYLNIPGLDDKQKQQNRTTDIIEASIDFEDSSKRWLSFISDNDIFFPTNWIRSGDYFSEKNENEQGYSCQPGALPYLNPCNYDDEGKIVGLNKKFFAVDKNKVFAKLLGGGVAPHRLVGYQADYMPMAYFGNYNPLFRDYSSLSFLPSVDIVITSDKSKWTRCPVIELGRDKNLNIGGAEAGALRKSSSVDKEGNSDGTGTGMGWFPGYAVDLESGARLYMAFGENSFLGDENGSDMIWNPTSNVVSGTSNPLMGGMHAIYVFSYKQSTINKFTGGYDFPAYIPSEGENIATNHAYQRMLKVMTNSSLEKLKFYGSLTWVAYPVLSNDQKLNSTDATIKLRVNKEYKDFVATGENGGRPMYSWSMDDIATQTGSKDQLAEALKLINVVPNPYYAFSEYERTRLDTRVKITNLPERCTVRIYTVNGKLVRTFKKDSPVTSLDWDLNNNKGIPVAGGVYLIHVEVPEVGEVILKFFGGMRQVDLQGI
jgi:hypothetical protein